MSTARDPELRCRQRTSCGGRSTPLKGTDSPRGTPRRAGRTGGPSAWRAASAEGAAPGLPHLLDPVHQCGPDRRSGARHRAGQAECRARITLDAFESRHLEPRRNPQQRRDPRPVSAHLSGEAYQKTERGGFEPPMSRNPYQISSLAHSTALPPLRVRESLGRSGSVARGLWLPGGGVYIGRHERRSHANQATHRPPGRDDVRPARVHRCHRGGSPFRLG